MRVTFRAGPPLFYGWYIALAAYIIHVLNGGLLFHAFGAYILPLQAEFGWSRAAVSGVFSMVRAESGILGPLQGWLVERYGPRAMMRLGLALFGLGYVAFSWIDSLVQFYLAFFLVALGSSLGGFIPISATIANWFVRRRATVLGLTMTGMGVGGLLVPLLVAFLAEYGWRETAFYSGVLIWVVGVPCTQFMRHSPERYGLRPDGDKPNVTQAENGADDEVRFSARQALRAPAFWFLSAGHSSALFVVGTVLVHQIPHMIEHVGLSAEAAAFNVTLLLAFSIAGQAAGGLIGDRVDKRWTMIVCMWTHAFALVLFAYAGSQVHTALFAVLHGTAWGVRGTLINAIRADYFGRAAFATISGFASLVVMIGMTAGPLFAGALYDMLGDYRLAFVILAGLAGLGSIFLWLARKPAPPKA